MKKAAAVIRKKTEHIIELWEVAVEKEIPPLAETEILILLNVLPQLLKDIATVLERSEDEILYTVPEEFKEIIEDSRDHGRHRAATVNFSAKRIIEEHKILHRALIMVLKSEGAYEEKVGISLSLIMESAMEYSIDAFNESLQDMREKLIATLAHDLRNPLSAANLGLSALKYEHGEVQFDKIKEMTVRSLKRSLALVEDLLDTVTVKAGEGISMNFSSCNFVEEVKLVFSEARESYSRDFRWQSDEKEILGIFDPTAVRRVVENLITNAVKYGSADGPITISIVDCSDKAILKVHNRGNSISPQDRKEIFNFLKCRRQEGSGELKSWGIGLSFVKMAAEAHKGYVDIESDEKSGTTFKVAFAKNANKPGRKRAVLNFMKGKRS
ncbi:sensor histidine kinase [Salinimicrobium sp. WS361]|uniref:sensor histidine kinase n=1 Tax=Salinimicrobium sp. WS361 TaxID=3425123 RepID=UPI003D6DF7C1